MSMHRTGSRALVAAAFAVTAVAGGAGGAQADPKGETFLLDCGDAGQVEVAVAGNGAFTPGHVVGSTSTLIPLAFGEFSGTLTTEDGTVLETFTEPGAVKTAKAPRNATLLECSFDFVETFDDPELGLLTFTGSGSVSGFATPAKP